MGWVRPHDEQKAVTVRQVKENHAVPDDQLAVPPGNVRSIALGSVLRGKCGMGEMHRVLPEAVSARGDGLDMLRSVQGTMFADLEDSMVSDWQHPVPVTELHHVEAAVMEWGKKRPKLRKLKRMMVDDPVVATASLEQLLGGSAVVKAIVSNLKLQHGSKMTVQQILDRVAVDSGAWLAEHNATAVLHGSGSVGAAAAAVQVANAAAVARGRGRGGRGRGGKGKGKTRGHCMEHQFRAAGCSRPAGACIYQHQPDQLGRFAEVKDANGTRECMVYGKLGSCSQGDTCPDAHMDVPGARGQLAGSPNVCLCCNVCGGGGGGGVVVVVAAAIV